MQLTFTNNELKVDDGPNYYIGNIKKEDFPSFISEKYEDIILKSFDNFSDENTTITHDINDNKYIITYKFNYKLLNISEEIKIDLVKHIKGFNDYTNERIRYLEHDIDVIKNDLLKFKNLLIQYNIIDEDNNKCDDDTLDDDNLGDDKLYNNTDDIKDNSILSILLIIFIFMIIIILIAPLMIIKN